MLPCHRIQLIFQRQSTDSSCEASDVCKALEIIESWFSEQDYEFKPYFHDRKKSEAIRKELKNLIKEFGLIARIKRYFKNEEWSKEEATSRITKLSKTNSTITYSKKYESILDFCEIAIAALDNRVVPNLITQGKPSKNWLSIYLLHDFHSYSMSLELYRFNDDTLEIAVSIMSPDAYDDKNLQQTGETYMCKLAESSNSLFIRRDA